jgi:hypothetical protein
MGMIALAIPSRDVEHEQTDKQAADWRDHEAEKVEGRHGLNPDRTRLANRCRAADPTTQINPMMTNAVRDPPPAPSDLEIAGARPPRAKIAIARPFT